MDNYTVEHSFAEFVQADKPVPLARNALCLPCFLEGFFGFFVIQCNQAMWHDTYMFVWKKS